MFFFSQFVAHPNVQQLLASMWYEGLPGFRQMNMILQAMEIVRIGLIFPIYSICYIVCPWVNFSQTMRKPFIKFICNSASYFFFLCKSQSVVKYEAFGELKGSSLPQQGKWKF